MKNAILAASSILLFLSLSASSLADLKNVEKVRRFYRDHGLDFFGELITNDEDFLQDEKKHAKLELLADDARSKALDQLEKLMSKAQGEMRAEFLMRKATLYADRARTAIYFQNNPFKAAKLQSSTYYLEHSIQAFSDVAKGYPNHARMDLILFSIAYNYGELKKVDDAFRYYSRLVHEHPDSSLVGDARLAMAEIHFDKRNFEKAAAELREIVNVNHPRLKNFALYKLAWTYYNMTALDEAIASLEKVIEGVNASGVQASRLELRKEALHDLVTFYADRPDSTAAESAAAYFGHVAATPDTILKQNTAAREKRLATLKAKGQPLPLEETENYQKAYTLTEPQELLFRLVQTYREQGKHEQSMRVAESLISALPGHPKSVALYRLRAESAEKLRRRDLLISELERFAKLIEHDLPKVSRYTDGLPQNEIESMSSFFSKISLKQTEFQSPKIAPAKLPSALAATQDATNFYEQELAKIGFETFKDFSAFLHGEWSKTSTEATGNLALRVYDLAIEIALEPWRGSDLKACFELRARRAQLRMALSKYDLAASDFHWLVQHSSLEESTQGEIAALEALLKTQDVKSAPSPDAKHSMIPVHSRLAWAYDAFMASHLSDQAVKTREMTASILAASARLYREYGINEEALHRMSFYSRFFPKNSDAAALTKDTLALYENASRWEELRDYSARVLELGFYRSTDAAKEITRSNEYASLKLLEKLERDKDWKKAASEFAEFAKKNPESSFVSQALMKSATSALELKDSRLAIERLEQATGAPDAKIQLQAWLGLEPFYRKAYQWKSLKQVYDSLLKLSPDSNARALAKQNLAEIEKLSAQGFLNAGETLINPDPDLNKIASAEAKLQARADEFLKVKNFKKKAELHAELNKAIDKMIDQASKSLQGSTSLWGTVLKTQLLLNFAETVEKAPLPAILKGASDADRKAYSDTLASQVKELRDNAHKLTGDAFKLAMQVDAPDTASEAKLNQQLEFFGEATRLSRENFAQTWGKRPESNMNSKTRPDAEIKKLGDKILASEKAEESRENAYELARRYAENGDFGFAYAVASALASERKDEWTEKAHRLQFALNTNRLPKALSADIKQDSFSSDARWDLARWLTANKLFFKEEKEARWFEDAVHALLRPVPSAASALSEKSRLSKVD